MMPSPPHIADWAPHPPPPPPPPSSFPHRRLIRRPGMTHANLDSVCPPASCFPIPSSTSHHRLASIFPPTPFLAPLFPRHLSSWGLYASTTPLLASALLRDKLQPTLKLHVTDIFLTCRRYALRQHLHLALGRLGRPGSVRRLRHQRRPAPGRLGHPLKGLRHQ